MRKMFWKVVAVATLVVLASSFAPRASAADAAPDVAPAAAPATELPANPPGISNDQAAAVTGVIGSVLKTLGPKYSWLASVFVVIGVLRTCFKPILTVIENIARATPSTTDDAFVDKAEHSTVFKWFAWALDYFASIKIGPQFKA